MGNHVLYRFFSATGQLLYIGITMRPPERFKSHEATKEWWSEVSGITLENCETRHELEMAERRAIQVERPLYNVIHNRQQTPNLIGHISSKREKLVTYICDVCGNAVSGKSGYIHVDYADMELRSHAWEELKAKNRLEAIGKGYLDEDGNPLDFGISVEDLMKLPSRAQWLVHHQKCDPDPDHSCYWFYVERADSHQKLLSWTAHLLDKSWLSKTNWNHFISKHISDKAKAC